MKLVGKILALIRVSPVTTGVLIVILLITILPMWKPYFINKFFNDSSLACANLLTKELSWKKPRQLLYYGDGIYSEKGNELIVYKCISNFGYIPDWEYGREIIKRNGEGWVREDLPEEEGGYLIPGVPVMF